MSAVIAPDTRLRFFDLSHPWGYGTPTMPGYEDIKVERLTSHAQHGVLTQKFVTTMQTSTHVNAPLHLIPGAASVGDIPIDRFFGNGVVLSVDAQPWELLTAARLQDAEPGISDGDAVLIDTGWHRRYADSQEYFGMSPGLSADAAAWLVQKEVLLVAVDTPAIDHPLATSLAEHRNGPQMKYLADNYRKATGRDPGEDFPDWNPAHRTLLGAGIPTIENMGGDVDLVAGTRVTVHACPLDWPEGDGCVVRLVAITDPSDAYRVEPGREV
jgi:kynurenine formamidase